MNKTTLNVVDSALVKLVLAIAISSSAIQGGVAYGQDMLPTDDGLVNYHHSPRYRESESHPLRIVGYVLHPIGWLAREAIFRPISYLASSTETTRAVFGYREPYDYRTPECFSADDSAPDCRSVLPFNYEGAQPGTSVVAPADASSAPASAANLGDRQVYIPDVNFDFNKRTLNDLGQGKVHQLAQLLKQSGGVHVVLQGHTDAKGTDAYNEKLGMDRAEAVRAELVSLGMPADKLSTVTFGETQPVFTEETGWAHAVNRRVEVKLDGSSAPVAPKL